MLVLRRKDGQWVDITHKSGDVIRIRIYNIRTSFPNQVNMVFDDDLHNFAIQRPERKIHPPPEPEPEPEAPPDAAPPGPA